MMDLQRRHRLNQQAQAASARGRSRRQLLELGRQLVEAETRAYFREFDQEHAAAKLRRSADPHVRRFAEQMGTARYEHQKGVVKASEPTDWRQLDHGPAELLTELAEGQGKSDRYQRLRQMALHAARLGAGTRALASRSPSAATPSHNPRPLGRTPSVYPDPEAIDGARKPNETKEAFYARVRRQVSQLGQAAPNARPVDASKVMSEESFSKRKAKLLRSQKAIAAEIMRAADQNTSTTRSTSAETERIALALMAERGWSTDRKAAGFRKQYITALKEITQ